MAFWGLIGEGGVGGFDAKGGGVQVGLGADPGTDDRADFGDSAAPHVVAVGKGTGEDNGVEIVGNRVAAASQDLGVSPGLGKSKRSAVLSSGHRRFLASGIPCVVGVPTRASTHRTAALR